MAAYCNEVRKLKDKFDGLELNHIARRFNEAADELAKVASGQKPIPDSICISNQYKPSIRYKELGGVSDAPPVPDLRADPGEVDNTPPILDSEADPFDPESLPTDKIEARRIACRARSFVIVDQELYKRSHTGVMQR
ncbi:uncharacterized protein [Setaria viridis]|uniref:uncharacterized protein n=1 Tax=Setaria viridis TaxID=4556 RepID=UPI0014935BFD|nr:uncharacterized protein LOC117854520 [Setaria viridis]